MSMVTVKELLKSKSTSVWTISPEASVLDALQMMADKDVGAVLVAEGDKLVGILSERDYARNVTLKGKSPKTLSVGKLMTSKVFYVSPDKTIDECMALMTDKHIRHLPVMENERLVGIVTIGDVVKQVIADQQFKIQEMEKYISGGGF